MTPGAKLFAKPTVTVTSAAVADLFARVRSKVYAPAGTPPVAVELLNIWPVHLDAKPEWGDEISPSASFTRTAKFMALLVVTTTFKWPLLFEPFTEIVTGQFSGQAVTGPAIMDLPPMRKRVSESLAHSKSWGVPKAYCPAANARIAANFKHIL